MAVPKYRRHESRFEVFHHWYVTRKKITETLLFDFGLKPKQVIAKTLYQMGKRSVEELDADQKEHYDAMAARLNAFNSWFIQEQRRTVMECMARVTEYVFMANSIEEFRHRFLSWRNAFWDYMSRKQRQNIAKLFDELEGKYYVHSETE